MNRRSFVRRLLIMGGLAVTSPKASVNAILRSIQSIRKGNTMLNVDPRMWSLPSPSSVSLRNGEFSGWLELTSEESWKEER